MAINDKQKIVIVNIEAATEDKIKLKLQQGYVILIIVSLTPVFNKLLIVYATPEEI